MRALIFVPINAHHAHASGFGVSSGWQNNKVTTKKNIPVVDGLIWGRETKRSAVNFSTQGYRNRISHLAVRMRIHYAHGVTLYYYYYYHWHTPC